MKIRDDLNDLHEYYIQGLTPHITTAIRELEGYEQSGNLICARCGVRNARRNRQCTNYCDDERNWDTLCPICQEDSDEYWKGMWKEYYGSVL